MGSFFSALPEVKAAPVVPVAGAQQATNDFWSNAGSVGNVGMNATLIGAFPGFAGFKAAFCVMEGLFIGGMGSMVYATSYLVNLQLTNGNNIGNQKDLPYLVDAWKTVRNLAISLLTLALIIIALFNIFNVNPEQYGLNRMIPKIIISIIMAYFSIVVMRFLLEFFTALQHGILNATGSNVTLGSIIGEYYKNNYFANSSFLDILKGAGACLTANPISQVLKVVVYAVMFIVLTVICLYLVILTYFRTVVLWFLLIVAPLAFVMNILPFSESLYKQWWQTFWKWAIMGPAIALGLWFATVFLKAYAATPPSGPDFTFLIMFVCAVFVAAAFPTILGGKIMGMVANRVQGAGKSLWNMSAPKQAWDGVKSRYQADRKQKAALETKRFWHPDRLYGQAKKATTTVGVGPGARKIGIAGMVTPNEKMVDTTNSASIAAYKRSVGAEVKELSTPEIEKAIKESEANSFREEALLETLATKPDFSRDDAIIYRMAKKIEDSVQKAADEGRPEDKTGGSIGIALKVNNPGLLATVADKTGSQAAHQIIVDRVKSLPISQWKDKEVVHLSGSNDAQMVLDVTKRPEQKKAFYDTYGTDVAAEVKKKLDEKFGTGKFDEHFGSKESLNNPKTPINPNDTGA
jgi:hypothetical protein